jgi:type IV pilus assembly protein PilB
MGDLSFDFKKPDLPSEQRRHEREPATGWRAMLFRDACRDVAYAEVVDYSAAGAGLSIAGATDGLAPGSVLTVAVEAQNRRFSRRAEVRWARADSGDIRVGLRYVDHTGYDPGTHQLNIRDLRVDPGCALKLPAHIALRQKALPFLEMHEVVQVACADAANGQTAALLERLLKAEVRLWQAEPQALETKLKDVYGDNRHRDASALLKTLPGGEQGGEAVSLGDQLLYAAYIRQASDIHIDPSYEGATIRFRVDGQLEVYNKTSAATYTELVSRFKVMASLDIAEKRSPQDGRFSHHFVAGGRRVDVRVATLPTKYGERVTMRLLAVQTDALTLDKLGFEPNHLQTLETFLRRIQGMMIMTGPTGSGKTTTLYAAIRLLLEERNVNIITIEDPIEYEIGGVAQCEVDNADKVNFGKALRSILRHDPDVVMIGEIRDRETADIAIKAALTGHMVLGTLHTNSAASTITRLIDMGVEPYLVAAALRLTVAQRLLRRLCRHCRIPRPLTDLEALALGTRELAGRQIYDPCGCIYCGGKGYAGRVGLYEMLELREDWARAVANGEGESELLLKMRDSGVKSLLDDALDKLFRGDIPVSEVIQIASSW